MSETQTIEQRVLSPDELLEQWANLVATQVVNELEDTIGLGDGDAAAICEAVIGSVLNQALPWNGGDLLRRGVK